MVLCVYSVCALDLVTCIVCVWFFWFVQHCVLGFTTATPCLLLFGGRRGQPHTPHMPSLCMLLGRAFTITTLSFPGRLSSASPFLKRRTDTYMRQAFKSGEGRKGNTPLLIIDKTAFASHHLPSKIKAPEKASFLLGQD